MPVLRLYSLCPDEAVDWSIFNIPAEGLCTVREYYLQHVQPERQRRGLAADTLRADIDAIACWERFGSSFPKRAERDQWERFKWVQLDNEPLSNPPIGIVTDADLMAFVAKQTDKGYSVATRNRSLRHLLPIFDHAGPRDRTNRIGTGAILQRPWIRLEDETIADLWIPTQADLVAFHDASQRYAAWPKRNPAVKWDSLLRFLTNYGLRTEDWLRLAWFENVKKGASELVYQAQKTARRRKAPTLFPINEPTQTALMQSRRGCLTPGRVFSWANSVIPFRTEWRRLAVMVGLDKTTTDAGGRICWAFTPQSLRQFCNNWYRQHAPAGSINPGEYVLNHGFKDANKVNTEHYTNVYVAPDWVQESILNLPQPF